MAIIKIKTATSAKSTLSHGELAVGANELYFGKSNNTPVRVVKASELSSYLAIADFNITTSTNTNGTGFLKGNGSKISFDNTSYLPSNEKAADSDKLDGLDSSHFLNASNLNAGIVPDVRLPSTFQNLTNGVENLPYKIDIFVYGDSDKYYPVHFAYGNQDVLRTIKIWRSYSERGPNDWFTSSHKGSLNLEWKGNYGSWGGASYQQWVYENSSEYTDLFGGTQMVDNSYAMAFFLRGGGIGGAVYHIASDQPLTWSDSGMIKYSQPTPFYNQELTFSHSTSPQYNSYAPEARTTINYSQIDSIKVVKGGDARLTNSRNAADVSAWAKKTSLAPTDIGYATSSVRGAVRVTVSGTTMTIHTSD